MGAVEELQKKAKYSITEDASSITDKRKLEILIEESLAPKAAHLQEEDAKVREKKLSFQMNERNKRETLAEQEEIESRRKHRKEFIESSPESDPKKQVAEVKDKISNQTNYDTESPANKTKTKAKELGQAADNSIDKREREIRAVPPEEESFQSVASSYFREKEVSKKIITAPPENIDRAGKIEIEIPADPQKLEAESRITQYPPKLELEKTFAKDPTSTQLDSDFLKSRHFEILTLAQLNDKNSTWHPVDQFRVYFSAQHRYYGIKDVRDIFPLWIYSGELAPEYLEVEKAWKFYDRGPQRFLLNDPLPIAVARFIQKMAGIPEDQLAEVQKNLHKATAVISEESSAIHSASSQKTDARPIPTTPSSTTPAPEEKEKNLFQYLKKVLGLGK